MTVINKVILIYLLLINLITFIVYFLDKRYAIKGKYRISELRLISLAAIGGAFGASLSMHVFRHKTQHMKFKILVPLFEVIWVLLIFYIIYPDLNTILTYR